MLASFAVENLASKGRVYPEKEDVLRTCFQRDRDRIIHSRAFRRLEGKTQVFVSGEGDHFRTRLTHTIVVAQIARDICRTLNLNEDLAEAIALAHDLGHTPFGHAGEEAMDEMMKRHGFYYEHNEQSKRIVEFLENTYPNFLGLNLSFEVLEGLMKHQTTYDNQGKNFKIHPSLEAQVVDISDEIAYTTHDIDDGLRSKLVDIKQLEKLSLWQDSAVLIEKEYGKLNDKKIFFDAVIDAIMTSLIKNLITQSEKNLKENKIKSLDDVYQAKKKIISFDLKMQEQFLIMKKFLKEEFYFHPKIIKKCDAGKKIIKKLFKFFEKNPQKLPENFRKTIKNNETKIIVIKDYIAGMTDDFAKNYFIMASKKGSEF